MIPVREPDERLGLGQLIEQPLMDVRRAKSMQFPFAGPAGRHGKVYTPLLDGFLGMIEPIAAWSLHVIFWVGGLMVNDMKQARIAALALIFAFGLTSCHGNNQQPSAQNSGQSAAQSPQDQDPAQVNQAPVGDQAASANQTAASSEAAPAQAPAPAESQPQSPNYSSGNSYPQTSATEVAEEAPQPPPPLPEYQQPECPEPNYLWTPGYWAWGPGGYYWVPGAWVAAPYEGALWTPGYWGYAGSRYFWHPGYWGPHIGFYGGINYGFGYVGVGFLGGFWRENGFHYNRSVTNVNTVTITNVYNRTVVNNVINNNTRASYNGGSGGIRYQPSRAELASSREPHVRALPAQVQMVRAAAANRAQFASVNRGRPRTAAMAKPVAVRPISPPAGAVNPGARRAGRTAPPAAAPMASRPTAPAARPAAPVSRPAAPTHRTATPAPRSATPIRPRTVAPARSTGGAAPRRTPPPPNPLTQRAPLRPATKAPARPATQAPTPKAAPRTPQTRKAPLRQPPPGDKKQEHPPN